MSLTISHSERKTYIVIIIGDGTTKFKGGKADPRIRQNPWDSRECIRIHQYP